MQLKQKCGIGLLVCVMGLLLNSLPARGQTRSMPVRVAYSALSAGVGVLWVTHEQGIFRKHGLDSNLVYMRSGTTAGGSEGLKGLEALRDSLVHSTPQLKQVDLRKFIDDRFVKAR